ncbi:MAG: hypothetical protein MZU84_03240 [Sphingobacterium sp.]|nr:hypothetical protein [Sphingobacterium sp.]
MRSSAWSPSAINCSARLNAAYKAASADGLIDIQEQTTLNALTERYSTLINEISARRERAQRLDEREVSTGGASQYERSREELTALSDSYSTIESASRRYRGRTRPAQRPTGRWADPGARIPAPAQ